MPPIYFIINSFQQSNTTDVQTVNCSISALPVNTSNEKYEQEDLANDEMSEEEDLASNEATLLMKNKQKKLFKMRLLGKYIF